MTTLLKTKTGMIEDKNLAPVEENPRVDWRSEPNVDSSNSMVIWDAINGNTSSLGVEDYNQLLSQYYELKEKKEQILQRLNQFGNWNYQCSGENFSYLLYFSKISTPYRPNISSGCFQFMLPACFSMLSGPLHNMFCLFFTWCLQW